MNKPSRQFTERAEFYLCLARAFLPPMEQRDFHAIREYLATELAELGAAIGYPIGRPLERLRAALARITGRQDLLQLYSRLFLVPPTPAHLNGGFYLDGAFMGQSTLQIEACYRRFGLVRSPDFHDAPDHLSSLLEFLALIHARAEEANAADDKAVVEILLREAGGFARDYVVPWLPALYRDLDGATAYGSINAYAALVDVLQTAVAHDFARADAASDPVAPALASSPDDASVRHSSDQLCCQSCGTAFIATNEMRDILLSLTRSGLGTEHLELCPECRTRSMGLSSMPAPDAKRLRH
jgi:TorA maturation chaperone TorD